MAPEIKSSTGVLSPRLRDKVGHRAGLVALVEERALARSRDGQQPRRRIPRSAAQCNPVTPLFLPQPKIEQERGENRKEADASLDGPMPANVNGPAGCRPGSSGGQRRSPFCYTGRIMKLSVLILALLAATGCREEGASAVQARLDSAVASGAKSFDFGSDPAFDWDRMFVFHPYTSQAEVESALGFKWPDYEDSSIAMSDGVVLILFVKDRSVVDWYEQRRTIDFTGLAHGVGYDRSDTTFAIDRSTGRIELKPLPPPSKPANAK